MTIGTAVRRRRHTLTEDQLIQQQIRSKANYSIMLMEQDFYRKHGYWPNFMPDAPRKKRSS
jgi:hypothetical protein